MELYSYLSEEIGVHFFFRLRILLSGGIGFIGFEMSNQGIAKGEPLLCYLYTQQYFSVKNSWRYWVKLFLPFVQNVLYGNCRFVSARDVVLWTAGSFFCEEIVGLRSAQRVVLSTCQWMFVRVPRLNFGVV